MAALEVIALDTATPQLRAPGTGDTYSMPRPVAITGVAGVPVIPAPKTEKKVVDEGLEKAIIMLLLGE